MTNYKTLEQIEEETKHLSDDQICEIIKQGMELDSLRSVNEDQIIYGNMYGSWRKINKRYAMVLVSLEGIREMPKDMKLRHLDFYLKKPVEREDLCKCVYMLHYLYNCNPYPESSFETLKDLMTFNYYDLYYRYINLKACVEEYGKVFDLDMGDLTCQGLVSRYNKMEACGDTHRFHLAMLSRIERRNAMAQQQQMQMR